MPRQPFQSLDGSPLDGTDLRLVGELVGDGRASFTALADRVGVSPAAARARVQRLIADRTITVSARIDARTTGSALIELVLLTIDRPAEQVAAGLDDMAELAFIVCGTGPWGLFIEVRCRDTEHLVRTYDRLRATPGVVDLEILPVVDYVKQDWSGLAAEFDHHRTVDAVRNPRPSPTPLDDIDDGIIAELMDNGRSSYAAIAPKVGLSPASVRTRIHRLLQNEIVVVQTLVSQSVLGGGMFAGALLSSRGGAAALARTLATMPESTLVVVTSGRHQVVCELWSRDRLHLLKTMDQIRAIDGVHRFECYPYLDIAKENYRAGHGN